MEIEIILNFNTISQNETAGQGAVEIIPEIYGTCVGTHDPVAELEESYFRFSEEEKIFLGRTPLKLQIESDSEASCGPLSKYLINKQNMIEYQLYEFEESAGPGSQLDRDDAAMGFIVAAQQLARSTDGLALKEHSDSEFESVMQKY